MISVAFIKFSDNNNTNAFKVCLNATTRTLTKTSLFYPILDSFPDVMTALVILPASFTLPKMQL